jgi:hypothetical protein
MDAATINAKIYAGRAKAALRIGYDYSVFRPYDALDPLTVEVATTKAAFNAGDNRYGLPSLYGKPVWFADMDGRLIQPGDYLVRNEYPADVKFVAAMQSLLPIVTIDCNRSIRVTAPPAPTTSAVVNVQGYSGICDAVGEYTDVLGNNINGNFTGWPCSILLGKGSQASPVKLPSGAPKDYICQGLLPPSIPIALAPGMRMIDDLGCKYEIGTAELTDMGWRILAAEEHS